MHQETISVAEKWWLQNGGGKIVRLQIVTWVGIEHVQEKWASSFFNPKQGALWVKLVWRASVADAYLPTQVFAD